MNILRNAALAFVLFASFSTARAADAIPIQDGTALARLVAEVSETKAATAITPQALGGVNIHIPSWLRLHYRRNHTEATRAVAPSDPTGGYPLALETLYAWMLLHQDLKASPPLALVAPAPAVGQNICISGQVDNPRSESDISINFKDPSHIIGASNNIGNSRQAQFFSTDGGSSWGQTALPLLDGDSLHSDPTVGWTSDGTAWATTIGIDASSTVLQLRAYRSTDGGKTWTFDATFSGDQTGADKQMMWVDHSPTSRYRDQIYVIWHNNLPAFVARRNALEWQAPIKVSGAETTGTAIGSDITTNADGDIFAVWPDTGSQKLFVVKSKDGGAKYTSPQQVAKTFARFTINVPGFAERSALIAASIGAFKNHDRDDVYVSWPDLSGSNGCQMPSNEPGSDLNSHCKSRIWFSGSTDGGKTWQKPERINDDAAANDQFNQKLAVDPETGRIGIIYYSTGSAQDRTKADVMFQFSADNGKTWSKPTKITTASTDETTANANSGNQYGDYNGLSANGGVFFPCWTDRRGGKAESIYAAKIALKQNAAGVPEAIVVPGNQTNP